jgi:hypothetical protein
VRFVQRLLESNEGRKSTENKRDVEFLAERKEVVGIVAHLDCLSVKYVE